MNLFLSIYVFGIIGFLIHLFKTPSEERTRAKVIELFLLYQIVFSLGITSFFAFIGLTFMPDYVAHLLDWTPCAFEQELANVNLAFGFLGILSIWYRRLFWVATILGFSIWIISDGIQHVYEFFSIHNNSEGNIGVPLYTDFAIPIVLLILLFLYVRNDPSILKNSSGLVQGKILMAYKDSTQRRRDAKKTRGNKEIRFTERKK